MGLFKKNDDPISERARALNSEIAALEEKIKKLGNRLESGASPRLRSTTPPQETAPVSRPIIPVKGPEPIFEEVDQNRLKSPAEPLATPEHFNDLGVRKYDLIALIDRIKKQFQGPSLSNPKLVNYLAAGSVQGLRPLRYEKRVARNRFIVAAVFLAIVMLGLLWSFARQHH